MNINHDTVLEYIRESLFFFHLLDDEVYYKNLKFNDEDRKILNELIRKGDTLMGYYLEAVISNDEKTLNELVNVEISISIRISHEAYEKLNVISEGERKKDIFKKVVVNLTDYCYANGELNDNVPYTKKSDKLVNFYIQKIYIDKLKEISRKTGLSLSRLINWGILIYEPAD